MVGGKVVDLIVKAIPVSNVNVVAKDNVAILMMWEDGSITSIRYFAIGSSKLPKEYIELYANGSSIVIDDFVKIHAYRDGSNKSDKIVKLRKQDKGHKIIFLSLLSL